MHVNEAIASLFGLRFPDHSCWRPLHHHDPPSLSSAFGRSRAIGHDMGQGLRLYASGGEEDDGCCQFAISKDFFRNVRWFVAAAHEDASDDPKNSPGGPKYRQL